MACEEQDLDELCVIRDTNPNLNFKILLKYMCFKAAKEKLSS